MFRGGEQQLPSYYIGRKTRANQNEKKNLNVNQNVHNNILSISVQEDYNPGRENTAIAESDDTKIFIITRTILVLEAVKKNGGALRYASAALKDDREIVDYAGGPREWDY